MNQRFSTLILGLSLAACAATAAAAGEWAQWRGPWQNGVSDATDLPDHWSKEGENLLWKQPWTGRSTPVVFDGRVCASGRGGEGFTRHESVACWDAGDGKLLWERRFNVVLTAVPLSRVGWASVAGDPETGLLYAHGVDGDLWAFDRKGEIVWEWSLGEDVGRASGYGGRTHTPIIDEDQLILAVIGNSWGEHAPPRHRVFSFDKRSGKILWTSTPGAMPLDLNTYSTPVVAIMGGQRLVIGGNADGWVYALKARTGELVWKFGLSKTGLNVSPAVRGNLVFMAHSEENLDEGTMGRVVAIDGSGQGDLTGKGEAWRSPIEVGFASPLVHGDRVYVIDSSANLFALDAATGKTHWQHGLGTVGKGSPVWADGKVYATEVNGNVLIVRPGEAGAETLDADHLEMPEGRYAEIYASVAVAYGRIYFTTEEGIYCLGDKAKPFRPTPGQPVVLAEEKPAPGTAPAVLQVVPAEVVTTAGEPTTFEVRAFDGQGRALGPVAATFTLAGLKGKLEGSTFTPDPAAGSQVGKVVAKAGTLETSARLRAVGPLPWREDFEAIAPGSGPTTWLKVGRRAAVRELPEGGKVLAVDRPPTGVPRSEFYLGHSRMRGYTIQADLMGTAEGRRRPDLGLINSGYTLDLQGGHQRVQVRSWDAELRVDVRVPFSWDANVWYTMKMRVDQEPGKAIVRGKVWKRGEAEPAEWTITAEDPQPVLNGTPGLYAYSAVELYFDNVTVTESR